MLAAARRALDRELLGYTEAQGIAPLRSAIAGHYRHRYGIDVDPGQVYVTTGSSGGFLLAFLSAFDAGDRVGLARPGYPAYRNILQALGCEVVDLPCGPETRYQPTLEMVAGLDLQGLVLAAPANPTRGGGMCTGSANVCWRRALHPPQLRRLFAPRSHLTGEQLLALVLALFIRHRLTAGHPDLTATGALDLYYLGPAGHGQEGAQHTSAPTWILSVRGDSLATSFCMCGTESTVLGGWCRVGRSSGCMACDDRLL